MKTEINTLDNFRLLMRYIVKSVAHYILSPYQYKIYGTTLPGRSYYYKIYLSEQLCLQIIAYIDN